jgi:predicted nuclease of restriction endonuclease-like (RecB) superfamily
VVAATDAREFDAESVSAVALIPWGHVVKLLGKRLDGETMTWYALKARQHGRSRAVLVHQVESGLHERAGAALTNFTEALASPDSELAQQMMTASARR